MDSYTAETRLFRNIFPFIPRAEREESSKGAASDVAFSSYINRELKQG